MAPTHVIPGADKISKESQTTTSTRRVAQLTGHLAPATETEQVNTRPILPIDYPISNHQIEPNRFIDDVRELKVAVVGAGLSGINAGILLPAKVPRINLTIFEKNDDVVGCSPHPAIYCPNAVHRVAPGWRTAIPAYAVISPHTSTNLPFRRTHNGLSNSPRVPRFVTIGNRERRSMMYTAT